MEETVSVQTPEAPSQPPATPAPADAAAAPSDPWASLPPDVQKVAEPVVKPLREKIAEYEKQVTAAKSYEEKAVALDRLTQQKDFQEWWMSRGKQKADVQPKNTTAYTPEEYQVAYDKANAGDPSDLIKLQERAVESVLQQKVTPALSALQSKAREVEMSFELNEMLRRHPDAKDLDTYGFLEPALHYYTDKLGRPMEFAYAKAKEAYDKAIGAYKAKEVKEIADKKGGVTERPGVVTVDSNVVYLDSPDAVVRAQVIANAKGEKVQYRLRPRK